MQSKFLKNLSSSLFFCLLVTVISLGGYYSCSSEAPAVRTNDGSTSKKDLKTNTEAGGSLGYKYGPCFPDRTCNNNLICSANNVCMEKEDSGVVVKEDGSKPMGSNGGPCYPNKACNNGLVCHNDICVPLTDGGQFIDAVST